MIALDTNIILLDANNLFSFPKDELIVLAETVVDELDSKKSDLTEIGYQAREFGRIIAKSNLIEDIKKPEYTGSLFEFNGTRILIAALREYPNFRDTASNIVNDRRIIAVACQFNAKFVSNDVMARVRASAEGLVVEEFKVIDAVDTILTRHVDLDDDKFALLSKPKVFISELINDALPETYNFVFRSISSDQAKLCTVHNELVSVLDKGLETEFRKQDIPPMNTQQMFFTWHLQNPNTEFVICEAAAGTGKSAVAISNGIRMVRQNHYKGILYIRSSVNDVDPVEEVGFLPGLSEKFAVYLHPLEDTLDFIARSNYRKSKFKGAQLEEKVAEYIETLREKANIQAMTTLGMRGRTFSNLYVIIDEAQNLSPQQMQKILTRIGPNCKLVILGSNNQIDNKYTTRHTNGLGVLLDAARRSNDYVTIAAVDLHKIVRSPMAEFAERLFSK